MDRRIIIIVGALSWPANLFCISDDVQWALEEVGTPISIVLLLVFLLLLPRLPHGDFSQLYHLEPSAAVDFFHHIFHHLVHTLYLDDVMMMVYQFSWAARWGCGKRRQRFFFILCQISSVSCIINLLAARSQMEEEEDPRGQNGQQANLCRWAVRQYWIIEINDKINMREILLRSLQKNEWPNRSCC